VCTFIRLGYLCTCVYPWKCLRVDGFVVDCMDGYLLTDFHLCESQLVNKQFVGILV